MQSLRRFVPALSAVAIAGLLALAARPAAAGVDVHVGVYVPGASVGYYVAPPPPPRVIVVDDYRYRAPPPRSYYYLPPPPPPRYDRHWRHHHHEHWHDHPGRMERGWRR